jgi:drug/metabolite transporter (DMT)-like permease
MLVVVSGALLAGHFLLWTESLRYTSIAASVVLVSMHPVVVALLSPALLRELPRPRVMAGTIAAIAGTVVTCAGDLRLSESALFGDALALGGAFCLAGYLLIGRGVRGSIGLAAYSAVVYAVVATFAAIVAVAQGTAHFPSARVALFGVALAAVCTIGGHTVYNWALRRVPALTVSVAFLGEAPLASLLGLALLHSAPSATTLGGGALILVGLGIALIDRRARPRRVAVTLPL